MLRDLSSVCLFRCIFFFLYFLNSSIKTLLVGVFSLPLSLFLSLYLSLSLAVKLPTEPYIRNVYIPGTRVPDNNNYSWAIMRTSQFRGLKCTKRQPTVEIFQNIYIYNKCVCMYVVCVCVCARERASVWCLEHSIFLNR
jgi:hypothetical protein